MTFAIIKDNITVPGFHMYLLSWGNKLLWKMLGNISLLTLLVYFLLYILTLTEENMHKREQCAKLTVELNLLKQWLCCFCAGIWFHLAIQSTVAVFIISRVQTASVSSDRVLCENVMSRMSKFHGSRSLWSSRNFNCLFLDVAHDRHSAVQCIQIRDLIGKPTHTMHMGDKGMTFW